MRNKKITRKIIQGMYVLTTKNGGCIVDAVSQVSAGDEPLIAVSVMKKNYTNELMHDNEKFALSVLGMDMDSSIIKTFGFNSMRDTDKFDKVETTMVDGVNVIDGSLGYMVLEKADSIDCDTHTLFIGKLIEADVFEDGEPMSYGYYQENKEDLLEVKTEKGKTAWVCTICGYIYYGDEVPEGYVCPICGVGRNLFKKQGE